MKEFPIIVGAGWRDIRLGKPFIELKEKLDYPDPSYVSVEAKYNIESINGTYYNYCEDGFQLILENEIIKGIRFFSFPKERFHIFKPFMDFYTGEGINEKSSYGHISATYGAPLKIISKNVDNFIYRQYLIYPTFDFWLENEKVVAIGISHNKLSISDEELEEITNYWEQKIIKLKGK